MSSAGNCCRSGRGAEARTAGRQPHAPPEPAERAGARRGCRHPRPALAAAGHERLHRRGAAAAHAGVRARSVRDPARGRSRAGRRRAAARAGLSALEPVGHARTLEPRGLSAGHAAPAVGAAACATGWCCSATKCSPSNATCTWGPGAADSPRARAPGACCARGLTYPLPAGAYLLKARKRVYTVTPIRPRAAREGRRDWRSRQADDAFRRSDPRSTPTAPVAAIPGRVAGRRC